MKRALPMPPGWGRRLAMYQRVGIRVVDAIRTVSWTPFGLCRERHLRRCAPFRHGRHVSVAPRLSPQPAPTHTHTRPPPPPDSLQVRFFFFLDHERLSPCLASRF